MYNIALLRKLHKLFTSTPLGEKNWKRELKTTQIKRWGRKPHNDPLQQNHHSMKAALGLFELPMKKHDRCADEKTCPPHQNLSSYRRQHLGYSYQGGEKSTSLKHAYMLLSILIAKCTQKKQGKTKAHSQSI